MPETTVNTASGPDGHRSRVHGRGSSYGAVFVPFEVPSAAPAFVATDFSHKTSAPATFEFLQPPASESAFEEAEFGAGEQVPLSKIKGWTR